MVALARFLEMSEEDLEMAGTGGLLLDVGKLKIPNEVLAKRKGLTPEELVLVRSHVARSVENTQSHARNFPGSRVEPWRCTTNVTTDQGIRRACAVTNLG